MCLKPITIPNPYYGKKYNKGDPRSYHDTKAQTIEVPCGNCSECVAIKQMNYVQRVLMESINNEMYMLTATYKNGMLPEITSSLDDDYTYADKEDFVKMIERFDTWRNRGDTKHIYPRMKLRYFGVTERGGNKGRPHLHALILVPKTIAKNYGECLNIENELYWAIRDNWTRNTGSRGKPNYESLFEYHEGWSRGKFRKNYDLHYVNPNTTINGVADAAFYVLKYMLKEQDNEENKRGLKERFRSYLKMNLEQDEYQIIWNTVKDKTFYSKYFGLNPTKDENGKIKYDEDITKYIRRCISWSKGRYKYPVFINPTTGNTFPLANYYKEKFMTLDDVRYFYKEDAYMDRPDWKENIKNYKLKTDKAKAIKRQVLTETELDNFLNFI